MSYKGAKEGQVVWWATNPWEEREEVVFVRYYKHNPSLLHPNMAIIKHSGVPIHVDIASIYKSDKPKEEQ